MKGKVELDWRKQKEVFENPHAVISEDDWVFKPKKISLLANLKENFCKGLQLKVDISDLNNILIEELVTLFSENKGNMHLEIEVYDDKIILPMTSRKFQIDLNNNFIKALDEMPQLKYNVLT
jgi:DNA polymerase-3 subunit alpha